MSFYSVYEMRHKICIRYFFFDKYVTYMSFYSVYEMRHKICIRYFFIDKIVILTPNIILIDR